MDALSMVDVADVGFDPSGPVHALVETQNSGHAVLYGLGLSAWRVVQRMRSVIICPMPQLTRHGAVGCLKVCREVGLGELLAAA